MPITRPPYPAEFRRQMVELVRAGRDPTDLAREFEPSAQAIRNWVAEADRQEGRREAKPSGAEAALSATEREELLRLRRENRQLKLERDILSSATAWFAREIGVLPSGSPVHEREPGALPDRRHGARAGRLEGRILCLVRPSPLGAGSGGRGAAPAHPHDPPGLASDLRLAAGPGRVA